MLILILSDKRNQITKILDVRIGAVRTINRALVQGIKLSFADFSPDNFLKTCQKMRPNDPEMFAEDCGSYCFIEVSDDDIKVAIPFCDSAW